MTARISKGGLIGAILGALASSKVVKSYEPSVQKVAKVSLFTAVGYFIGQWIEKLLSRKF